MYSVLLVDDETNILSGLQRIIAWDKLGCQIVGTAPNGLIGCEMALELKPDIIVTDIRMPYLDGLEMIAKLKAVACPAHFIVLSGYSEFEYAKKGIELGVNFYILKPVEETELEESLRRVIATLESDRQNHAVVEQLRQTAERNRESLREFVLRDIIDAGSENAESLRELLLMIGFPVADTQYLSLLFEWGAEGQCQEGITTQWLAILADWLGGSCRIDAFRYTPSQLAVILAKRRLNPAELAKKLFDIRYCCAERSRGELTIGMGRIYSEITGISRSFEEARYALSYQMIKGKNRVIVYEEIAKTPNGPLNISQDDIRSLEDGIVAEDLTGCSRVIDNMLRQLITTPGIRLPDIQLQCLNILLAGIRKMGPMPMQLNEHLGKHILALEGIDRFQTVEQLKQWLLQVVQSIIAMKSLHQVTVKKDLITEVKEYITFNYQQNLTLAVLASRFFINPFYLSQLFKEKTGETYLNYVMKIRMNKAKELLEATDQKITEICQAVGYTDAKYFSKLFEKLVGCKPSEYRLQGKRG